MASEEEKRRKREEKEAKRIQNEKDWKAINDRQEKANQKRRQDAIEAAAQKEAMERLEDDFLDQQFLELFNVDAKLAREYMEAATGVGENLSDEEALQALKALNDAQKAKQGGFFTSPNPEKAKNIIKKNRKAIQNTINAGKKKKGWFSCAVLTVPLVGGLVAILYGMYEGVSAIAGALF